MAQCEQTTLYFDVTDEYTQAGYVDLSSAMTAANRKQYHQVARNGNALCYTVRVRSIKGQIDFRGLSKAFITCNAVKQVGAGWKAQLRHAGVKLKDLSPMGRRPRFGLERFQTTENTRTEGGVDDPVWEMSKITLQPKQSPGGGNFFTNYVATDGNNVAYRAFPSPTVDDISANQITMVTVTDGAGTESNKPLVMSGHTSGEFNVISEYLKARRQTPDVSIDTPGPTGDSEMLNLFSVAEEMSDDIIDAVEHYMDYKPYTPDHLTNTYDDLIELCNVDAASVGEFPPMEEIIDVPLGLLGILGDSSSCNFRIDVLAIYEMWSYGT